MKLFSTKIIVTLALLFATALANAQIYYPEGLNMPGAYDSFNNPPDNLKFANPNEVPGGKLDVNTALLGQRVWQTQFSCSSTSGDITPGNDDFLFSSGPSGNQYENKWGGVTSWTKDVVNNVYLGGSQPNNNCTFDDGKFYTMNWLDNGYNDTRAVIMETSAAPVDITSVSNGPSCDGFETLVSITFSNSPVPEEIFYVRYSTDGFATSGIAQVSTFGASGAVQIPVMPVGTTVSYYVFSSTVSLVNMGSDYDLCTMKINSNSGSNYSFTVNPNPSVELTTVPGHCGRSDGAVNSIPSGGTPGYTYSWSTTETTQNISGDPDGTYDVYVTDTNGCTVYGSTQLTNTLCATPIPIGVTYGINNFVTFWWNKVPCAYGYRTRHRIVGSANWTTIDSTILDTIRTWRLQPSSEYEAEVESICSPSDSTDTSGYSAPFTFATQAGCNVPEPTSATAITSSSATVSWSYSGEPAKKFAIHYKPVGTSTWSLVSVKSTFHSVNLTGLSANTKYAVRIRSNCSTGVVSSYSRTLNFRTAASTLLSISKGISDHWTVAPNPMSDHFLLSGFSADSKVAIRIYDALGKVVYTTLLQSSGGEYSQEIQMPNVSAGIYFVELTSDQSRQLIKISKQ